MPDAPETRPPPPRHGGQAAAAPTLPRHGGQAASTLPPLHALSLLSLGVGLEAGELGSLSQDGQRWFLMGNDGRPKAEKMLLSLSLSLSLLLPLLLLLLLLLPLLLFLLLLLLWRWLL